MRLMVYARYGRAGIYMMQEYCRLLGIGASAKDLLDLGATIEALPSDHPISWALRRAADFRRPEAIADALLHPQDRAYTVPELYAWLDRCGMSFGRWIEQAPYLAQCGTVERSPHAARLASLPPRLQHAAVELFRGTMVSHSFIAYRDDRPDASQPINFAGDGWRDYVPVALPWTVCVRERLPPGSVAVLINRSHKFTDLVCTVNSSRTGCSAPSTGTEPWRKFCSLQGSPVTAIAVPCDFRAPLEIRSNRLRRVAGRDCERIGTRTSRHEYTRLPVTSYSTRVVDGTFSWPSPILAASIRNAHDSRAEPANSRDGTHGSLLVLALLALIVGAISGLVGAIFRLFLERADRFRDAVIVWAHSRAFVGFSVVVIACAAAAGLAAWLVRRYSPYASGSGIPHVEAVLNEELAQARFASYR